MFDFADARARRMAELDGMTPRERRIDEARRAERVAGDVGYDPYTVPVPTPLLANDRTHLLPTLSEEQRLYLEGVGIPALGATAGERLVNSVTYRAWQPIDPAAPLTDLANEGFVVPVAARGEVDWLAATTLIQSRTVTSHHAVWPQLTPLSAFTSVPADIRVVRPWTFDGSEPAAITAADGTAGPELTVTVGETDRPTHRATVNLPIKKHIMIDSAKARDLVDRALMRSFLRVLAKELFVGGGLIVPVNTYPGVPSIAKGADARPLTILKVIESIEANGWGDQPIVVLLHPTDKRVLFDEVTFNPAKFESVRFLGFDKLTQGTGFAAAVGSGTLHSSEITVSVSPDHASDFLQGMLRVQVEGFVDMHLPDVGSFAKITGL